MTTEARDALAKAWSDLEADALASDGPIRDRDVKDAISRNRDRIETLARTDLAARDALLEPSEVVRMLEGIRRDIEVMGEDGECSLRTIRGVQYVAKDDAMLAVDDRLGVMRLRAYAARDDAHVHKYACTVCGDLPPDPASVCGHRSDLAARVEALTAARDLTTTLSDFYWRPEEAQRASAAMIRFEKRIAALRGDR